MSGELRCPVVQLVLASPADRARRKARGRVVAQDFLVLDEVIVALESDDNNFLGRQ